jgi:hypothetical protein
MVHVHQLVELPFFQGMPRPALDRIAESASELSLAAGRTFVHQYDRAMAAFSWYRAPHRASFGWVR